MDLATHASRPRFRTDLVAECIDTEGQRFIDVIDPDTGDAFRFYEVEYSIACAMDGERDVGSLQQWAREELGVEPTRAELETVISTLGDLGYLDRAGTRSEPVTAQVPRIELGRPGEVPIVSAPEPRPTAPFDVELGSAGGTPEARASMPVEDIELGMAGGHEPVPMPTLRRGPTVPDSDEDGPTHLPPAAVTDFDDEVSVDLSEHMGIRPSDVKEAVRMSRSMKAVEVPPEVLEDIGQKEAEAAERALQARQEAAIQARPTVKAEPAHQVDPEMVRPPTELPDKPVQISKPEREAPRPEPRATKRTEPPRPEPKPPVAPPTPEKRGTRGLTIALFLILLIVAGGYFGYEYWWKKRHQGEGDEASQTSERTNKKPIKATGHATAPSTGAEPATAKATGEATGTAAATGAEPATGTDPGTAAATGADPATGTDPGTAAATGADPGTGAGTATPPAPKPEATLEAVPATVDVTATAAGVVANVAAAGSEVKAGDMLVQLKGKNQKKIDGLIYDIEKGDPMTIAKAQKALDAATKSGDKKKAKEAQAKIDERTRRIAEKKEELAKLTEGLMVTAPQDGKVVSPVKKGARVAAGDVVAKLDSGGGNLVGTFDVGEASYEVGASVQVASKDGSQQATCNVTKVAGAKVTVTCAEGAGLGSGAAVVLD